MLQRMTCGSVKIIATTYLKSKSIKLFFFVQCSKDGAYCKYKGFCARLGPHGKLISLQGLLEFTQKNWGSQAFFRDN